MITFLLLLPRSFVDCLNSVDDLIRNIVVLLRLVGNKSDQADHAGDGKDQEGDVHVQGEVSATELRVDTVGDGLTDRLERSEETTRSRGGLDVGREGAENPVNTELAPVARTECQRVCANPKEQAYLKMIR